MSNLEIFPIIDETGKVIGKASRQECHSGSKLLHPVVHLHVFDKQGRLYLQQRALTKFIQPGKWDTAVGGHVDFGESIEAAVIRETREELNFTEFTPTPLFSYIFESDKEKEMVNAFWCETDKTSFEFNQEEVINGKFWTIAEINEAIGKNILTPNFELEFQKLMSFFNSTNE